SAAAVDKCGASGHERYAFLECARQQVGGVDVVRQAGPYEQAPFRMRPLRLAGEVLGQRIEHHVAPAAIDLDQRPDVLLPRPGIEVRADEVLGDRGGAEV